MTRANALPDGYHLTTHITVREIQGLTADEFDIPVIEMVSARRGRKVSRPRQVAMFLARNHTPYSLPNLGRFFGNRDHTTIMHGISMVEGLIKSDCDLAAKVTTLHAAILSTEKAKSVDKSIVTELPAAA